MSDTFILYEDIETSNIKYISFIGKANKRFDLAIIQSDRFYGKKLICDIQSGRLAIIGKDDLEEPGYLEEAYNLLEEEANDLHEHLIQYY